MRMWMLPPVVLCRQHLLGEHYELHMQVGTIIAGRSIAGWVRDGFIDPYRAAERHAELVIEMRSRGMNHKSPLPLFSVPRLGHLRPCVDIARNYRELAERCGRCRLRIEEYEHAMASL